jgi:tripartite-type tricarboxylate transporter receptor subunit TctC
MLPSVVRNFALGAIAFGVAMPGALSYPTKPVRMVTAEAGGGADFQARTIAQELTSHWGQQVIVDNRGAASGLIAAQTVIRAAPDGYTLLFYSGLVWTLPFLKDVPYDPMKDLVPITLVSRAPNILVVTPSLPAKSVRELIAVAKAQPGDLSYASSGSGGTPHLAAELFKAMAGVNIVHVPYKGQAPALTDLLSGRVQVMFPNAAAVAPHVKSGKVRALAITTPQPSALASGLPTVAASGLPGYESGVLFGLFVPARTSAVLVRQLNADMVRVLEKPDVKEKLFNVGVEAVGSSQEQFLAAIKADMARWGKVIKVAGIRID